MGYYVINNLIKERIKYMFKQLADFILKSFVMFDKNAENLNKLAEFVSNLQDNVNLLATKVLELEKRNERSSN